MKIPKYLSYANLFISILCGHSIATYSMPYIRAGLIGAKRFGYYGLSTIQIPLAIAALKINQLEDNGHSSLFNKSAYKSSNLEALVAEELDTNIPIGVSSLANQTGGLLATQKEILVSPHFTFPSDSEKKENHLRAILHHEGAHIKYNDAQNKSNLAAITPFIILGTQKTISNNFPALKRTNLYKSGFRKGILHGALNFSIAVAFGCIYSRYIEKRADNAIPNTKKHLEGAIDYFENNTIQNLDYFLKEQASLPLWKQQLASPLHPPASIRVARFKQRLANLEKSSQ